MPLPSGGVFHEMSFTTECFGRQAITMLQAFTPSSIHEALEAQLPHLVTIHDTGGMPKLGITGPYQWLLAVWSVPPPTCICLMVGRTDHQLMSLAEGLRIEKATTQDVHPTAIKSVSIMPRDMPAHRGIQKRMWDNVANNRHWSHGLV